MNRADRHCPGATLFERQVRRSSRCRHLALLFVLLALARLPVWRGAAAAGASTGELEPTVRVLRSDGRVLDLVFQLPPPQQHSVSIDGLPAVIFELHGYELSRSPGLPSLPQGAFWLAVPPGTTPRVDVLDTATIVLSGVRVAPAPRMELASYTYGDPHSVPEFTEIRQEDPAVYLSENPYPASPASLGDLRVVRDVTLVPLLIHPVRVSPIKQEATVYQNLTVRVTFEATPGLSIGSVRPQVAADAGLLAGRVLNYEQALTWAMPAATAPTTPTVPVSPCLDGNAFRVTVKESGMARIEHSVLVAAGLPATVSANGLRMCLREQEVAIRILDGDGDGVFESGDSIVFFGESLRTQETETNVYWLTYGGAAGLRIQTEQGSPGGWTTPDFYTDTQHLEVDAIYFSRVPDADLNDHWYWRSPLNSAGDSMLSAAFELSNLYQSGGDLPVSAEVWGWNNHEEHTYQVKLNGTVVQPTEATFFGAGINNVSHVYQGHVAPQLAVEGTNTLTVQALENQDGSDHLMLVNWLEISVRRSFDSVANRLVFAYPDPGNWDFEIEGFLSGAAVYDVSNPLRPIRIMTSSSGPGTVSFSRSTDESSRFAIAGTTGYLSPISVVKDTPSNLRAAGTQADYIVITDPSLSAALQPLVNRRATDYAVKVAYVQDIFDEFNFGVYSTGAIKAFLAHAYDAWQGTGAGPNGSRPSFVLLAGEGSYDHRNVLGLNGAGGDLVPVYLRSGVDSNLGEAGADNQYVDVDGDDLADMLLGRIPAANPAELTAVVNKILAYEDATPNPSWQRRHLFLSDNGYLPPVANPNDPCEEDPAGDFFWHVDNFLANHFPETGQAYRRIYYAPPDCFPRDEYPTYEPYFAVSPDEATLRFIAAYNEGNQIVSYIGHSSILEWGREDYMTTNLVSQLGNGDRTPIMLPLTCLTGFYHQPQGNSLSESFLELVDGGSVASYAPTGLQVQTGHDLLQQGFYKAVYEDGVGLLGEAVLGAKLYLAANASGVYDDLQDTYMLLGDPAMQLNLCGECSQTFLPATLIRGGP